MEGIKRVLLRWWRINASWFLDENNILLFFKIQILLILGCYKIGQILEYSAEESYTLYKYILTL